MRPARWQNNQGLPSSWWRAEDVIAGDTWAVGLLSPGTAVQGLSHLLQLVPVLGPQFRSGWTDQSEPIS